MLAYRWPGNVRELIEQCVIMANDDIVDADELHLQSDVQEVAHGKLPDVERDLLLRALNEHGM